MDTAFSEFAFVYAHVRELEWKYGWSTPYFPTTREEGRLGYDLRMDGPVHPVFLQYKVSQGLQNPRSTEWKAFEEPYYRFKIYPELRSKQHNLLRALSEKVGDTVFYCVPGFVEEKALYDCREHGHIVENSAFISCYNIPKIEGNDKHCICYSRNLDRAFMYSDPVRLKIYKIQDIEKMQREKMHYGSSKELREVIEDVDSVIREEEKKSPLRKYEEMDERFFQHWNPLRTNFIVGDQVNSNNYKQKLDSLVDYLASRGIVLCFANCG